MSFPYSLYPERYLTLSATLKSITPYMARALSEPMIETDKKKLRKYLLSEGLDYNKIGIENGQMSIFLCKKLRKKQLPLIRVDVRHMSTSSVPRRPPTPTKVGIQE